MAYPPLPDTAFLHPRSTYPQSYQNQQSSGSSSSVEPITPELASSSTQYQRRISSTSIGEDDIECRWVACDHTATSADELYDHLCNVHVGRKSTNNLNLACKWEGCGVKCVKRDHITSHLRGESLGIILFEM